MKLSNLDLSERLSSWTFKKNVIIQHTFYSIILHYPFKYLFREEKCKINIIWIRVGGCAPGEREEEMSYPIYNFDFQWNKKIFAFRIIIYMPIFVTINLLFILV